jgi:hypothetical protein
MGDGRWGAVEGAMREAFKGPFQGRYQIVAPLEAWYIGICKAPIGKGMLGKGMTGSSLLSSVFCLPSLPAHRLLPLAAYRLPLA